MLQNTQRCSRPTRHWRSWPRSTRVGPTWACPSWPPSSGCTRARCPGFSPRSSAAGSFGARASASLPGPELARLGALAVRGLTLAGAARPPLELLAERTGETVNLAVRDGDRALNVLQVDAVHFVGVTDWTGRAAPLHASANGKALLAFGEGRSPAPGEAHAPDDRRARRARAELERTRERRVRGRGRGAGARPARRRGARLRRGRLLRRRRLGLRPGLPAHRAAAPVVGELCAAAAADVSARLGFRRAA